MNKDCLLTVLSMRSRINQVKLSASKQAEETVLTGMITLRGFPWMGRG